MPQLHHQLNPKNTSNHLIIDTDDNSPQPRLHKTESKLSSLTASTPDDVQLIKKTQPQSPISRLDHLAKHQIHPTEMESTPLEPLPVCSTFAELGLNQLLVDSCKRMRWEKPTSIQCQTIPWALKRRDVIALAQTGSGKTAAFALPILDSLLERAQQLFALVLAPTRELAFQISEQFSALGLGFGLSVTTLVGGIDLISQAISLAKKPHIVVGTPGRVLDHLQNTKGFSLASIKYLVLDEADRLLSLEFEGAIDKILEQLPRERNTLLFSATMTSKVAKLQRMSLRQPIKVQVANKYQTVDTLCQEYLFIPEIYKDCYLVYLLVQYSGNSTIIFCSKCVTGQRLSLILLQCGFQAIVLHGQMSQDKRIDALTRFKAGDNSILVATDVASRGLHVHDVDLVINYDIPLSPKDYIHRVGRTARVGKSGKALNLVTQYDVEHFQKIESHLGLTMGPYPAEESTVLLLMERVAEAQRHAANELRNMKFSGKKRRGGGGLGSLTSESDVVDSDALEITKQSKYRTTKKRRA